MKNNKTVIITGGGTGASGNISFDLEVGTIDGGTY